VRLFTILDGYIARGYIAHLTLIVSAFWALYVVAELMDLLDDVQQNKVDVRVVVGYFFSHTPEILQLVAPVAFLLATLTILGVLTRRNEITAMKAGGISIYRACLPIFVTSCVSCAVHFGLSEYVVPFANRVAQQYHNTIKGRPTQSVRQLERRWLLGKGGIFYEVTTPDGTPDTLHMLTLYDIDRTSWRLRDWLYANRARWNPQVTTRSKAVGAAP